MQKIEGNIKRRSRKNRDTGNAKLLKKFYSIVDTDGKVGIKQYIHQINHITRELPRLTYCIK
eukprot:15358680-Ditylum_brightwellii.AAC.1